MTPTKPPDARNEAFWHDYLTNRNGLQTRGRRLFSLLPHGPAVESVPPRSRVPLRH